MTTETPIKQITLQDLIARRLRRATKSAASTISFVPPEKLDYKPTETANSCRDLAAHIVEGNGYCLAALGLTPAATPDQTKIDAINQTGEQLANYAENASDELMASSVDFFGSPMPIPDLLLTAEWHIARHTGQIDYLQTTWGDLENH